MTLPTGQRYGMGGGEQAPEIKTLGDAEPFRAFIAIRNPGGFGDPCSTTDTQKSTITPTTDALIDYVEGLPGATVTTSAPRSPPWPDSSEPGLRSMDGRGQDGTIRPCRCPVQAA